MTDNSNTDEHTEEKEENQITLPELKKVGSGENNLKLATVEFEGYDTELIEEFLDVVFQNLDEESGASVLTWRVNLGKQPVYPRSEEKLYQFLNNSNTIPTSLYYGTSSCIPDPVTGKLRNRKNLFHALHVIVLDDIGAKVPVSRLPKNFSPTYIIESSKGNFQYGYVLTEPVTNLPAAEALIQFVYESGMSDEGGKMPNKLVRLPAGVNGKKGEKQGFHCRLVELNDAITYTAQEILDAFDLGVNWEDILKDAEGVLKQRALSSTGTSLWSPTKPVMPALNGIIDPVLEWLYENDQVVSDNGGEWLEVLCPWGSSHSAGTGETAGYSPLGRGDDPCRRGFNCFHEHCKLNKTQDFLFYVLANGGPEGGVYDVTAKLTATWVFDDGNNWAWELRGGDEPRHVSMAAFKENFSRSVKVVTPTGKVKFIKEHAMWTVSPTRVRVAGQTFDPSTISRLVEYKGLNYINTFAAPVWPTMPVDIRHVSKFDNFLEYLIPDLDDREFFKDWLAAKVQNMGFRGPAILMIANKQGVGRSTLTDMIATLLGRENTETVPFKQIIGDGEFNEWIEKPMVFSDETLSADKTDYYHSYEKLKALIDPRAKRVTINPKYGCKRETNVNSSFIFLSNHGDALVLPEEDRRFYVMYNALIPESGQYFTQLNNWLNTVDADGNPEWAKHIWNHLKQRDVNLEMLLTPPPKTQAKMEMMAAARSPLSAAVEILCKIWPTDYADPREMVSCITAVGVQLNLDTTPHAQGVIKKLVGEQLLVFPANPDMRVRIRGKQVRPRALVQRVVSGKAVNPRTVTGLTQAALTEAKYKIKESLMQPYDKQELIKKLSEALHDEGF